MRNLLEQEFRGFKLVQLIGSGGFGAVYRAHQASVDREVAVKVILPEHANNPKFIRNFDAEAHLIARLEHPYIVPLFDYWREPSGAYLVMRYYAGGNLNHRILNEGALSVEDTARILDQIASALDAAHRNNVIHRDIKPANIMLDMENNGYLGDFGLARNLTDGNTENRFVGSPAYVAPEIIQRHDADARADIYSLAFVVYEMLTGRYAYLDVTPASEFQSVLDFHLNEPIPDIPDQSEAVNMVLHRATSKDPDDRYQSAGAFALAFREAIKHTTASHLLPAHIPNPYKGLRAFEEADASTFFGREGLVRRLLNRMEEDVKGGNFLALVGPSGSGKSSTVYAGLLPALREGAIEGSDHWYIVDMLPGAEPLVQLTAALRSVATTDITGLDDELRESPDALQQVLPRILPDPDGTLLLVIDHFEELFTQTMDYQDRKQFLQLIQHGLASDNLRVIVLLRADFYDRPMLYEGFGELIQARTEVVLPLNSMELNNVIINPAKFVGLEVQPELTAAMVADVRDEVAALPLLQYALTEMFERNDASALTLEAYQAIGGVAGALAHRADEVYAGLSSSAQQAARQIFLRLVTLGEGTEDTRRRAKRSELLSVVGNNNVILQSVLDTFGKFRLLTFDHDEETREPTVEVAHEALIREWQQLRQWLDASRNDIRQQRALYHAALEWKEATHDVSYLLRGSHLTQLMEWSKTTRINLNDLEERYLRASINEMEREQEAESKRQQHEEELEVKSRQRLHYLIGVLASAAVIALMLTAYAFWQSGNARRAADEARRMAMAAIAQEALLMGESDTAMAFAMQSVQADNGETIPELAVDALLQVAYAPGLQYEAQVFERAIEHMVFSADNNLALLAGGRNITSYLGFGAGARPQGNQPPPRPEPPSIVVWDVRNNQELKRLTGHAADITDVIFLPPTEEEPYRAVSVSGDGHLIFWDWEAVTPHLEITDLGRGYIALSVTDDGSTLLVSVSTSTANGEQIPGEMLLIDTASGEVIERIPEQHSRLVLARLTADGNYVVALYGDGTHIVWNLVDDTEQSRFVPTDEIRLASVDLVLNPDSQIAATNTGNVNVVLWDITTGQPLSLAHAATTVSHRIAFDETGTWLFMLSRDSVLSIWNVDGSYLESSLATGGGRTISLAVAPDGETAMLSTVEGILRVYATVDLPVGLIHTFEGEGFGTDGLVFEQDNRTLLLARHRTGEDGDNLILWDVETGERIQRFARNLHETRSSLTLSISPNQQYVAGVSERGMQLWDMNGVAQNCRFCQEQRDGNPMDFAFIPTSGLNGIPLQAVVEQDNVLYLWDIDNRNDTEIFTSGDGEITGLDVSSDGTTALLLITPIVERAPENAGNPPPPPQGAPPQPVQPETEATPSVLLWLNLETGEILHRIELDSTPTVAVFVPNTLQAAVALTVPPDALEQDVEVTPAMTGSTTVATDVIAIVIIDPMENTQDVRFVGHIGEIQSIRFSSDGQRMVTGSSDRNAIIWDFATGAVLHTIPEFSVVVDAQFTLDDSRILTFVTDESPALWRSTPFTLEEAIAWATNHRAVRSPLESECRRYQVEDFCFEGE